MTSELFSNVWRVAEDVTAGTGVTSYWYQVPGVPNDAPVIIHVHGGGRVAGMADPSRYVYFCLCEKAFFTVIGIKLSLPSH